MSEFMDVPHALFRPHACATCGSSKGPFVDTHRELHPIGHIFVCKLCGTRIARAFGLVKGARMDELVQAGDLLEQARQEIAQRAARQDELVAKIDERDERIAKLTEDVEFNAGRAEQLKERLEAQAKAALELVGSPSD